MNKNLIAVYGSLCAGLHNHRLIEDSKYLGQFESKPEYNLYALGSFPGLKEDGETSVRFEVYEVDDVTARRVDMLEGYKEGGNNTFYDKKTIETPFGDASIYIYMGSVRSEDLVKSGDWVKYFSKKLENSRW